MREIDPEHARIWAHQDRFTYHSGQMGEPYRSTVHLAGFIRSIVTKVGGEALDVGCGAGQNILHLSQMLGPYRWTGLDYAGDAVFGLCRQQFRALNLDVALVAGDFYKLTEVFPGRKFDLVLSIQTLLGIPERYEEAVAQLLAVTRGWLFVTSLFTDFPVDAKIEVMDYGRSADCQGPFYYNVYSLARFRHYCEEHGCRDFQSMDFEIDIDLPPSGRFGMTTFTKTLADGKRIQLSGPLHMPWKFIAMRID
jgi:SAM-dependent methyltransferase